VPRIIADWRNTQGLLFGLFCKVICDVAGDFEGDEDLPITIGWRYCACFVIYCNMSINRGEPDESNGLPVT